MNIAIVCSAHGFGHLTRSLELAAALVRAGATPTILTATPSVASAWDPTLQVEHAEVDVGFVQVDGVTEDVPATLDLLAKRCDEAGIDALAERLVEFDLVVADTPPPALEAARRAGVPAVAVGNFDWAWIYAHYEGMERWADTFRDWQHPHPAIQLWPGPGLRGFSRTARFGVLGRTAPSDRGVVSGSVLVAFSAHALPGGTDVLPVMPGVTWVVDDEYAGRRDDFTSMAGRPFPGLVAAADVVVTKPGYGIVAECLLAGTRVVWFRRGRFPEAPSLEAIFRGRDDPQIESVDPAAVARAVSHAFDLPAPSAVGDPREADRIAEAVVSLAV